MEQQVYRIWTYVDCSSFPLKFPYPLQRPLCFRRIKCCMHLRHAPPSQQRRLPRRHPHGRKVHPSRRGPLWYHRRSRVDFRWERRQRCVPYSYTYSRPPLFSWFAFFFLSIVPVPVLTDLSSNPIVHSSHPPISLFLIQAWPTSAKPACSVGKRSNFSHSSRTRRKQARVAWA